MELLPEGKSIGWMQAPPQWIFSHTLRFVGIVRIVIQDGEGFILINKGKALTFYFKHGRIELRGNAALDYFNSNPTIEFNLSKYTPEEMAEAMKICHIESGEPRQEGRAEVPAAPPAVVAVSQAPEPAPAPMPIRSEPVPSPAAAVPHTDSPAVEGARPRETGPETGARSVPERAAVPDRQATYEAPVQPAVPLPATIDEDDIRIISQIKKLNGIVAISVFNDDRNIVLMGDVEIEPLLRIARSLLATTRKITPHLDWGQFVHMTLQIPEGNVIIAPYRENYLCLLTTRTINIGHIRRILRDLQVNGEN
ncbi:MAG TPA: hypothetical protein VLY83_02375 [Methanoregula sp.]|nr:hypothetical protein [Methanoregula sp.]